MVLHSYSEKYNNVNDENWDKYVKKAEKRKTRFEFFDEEYVNIKEEDFHENLLFTNKDKWKELKATKDVVWH